MEQFGLVVGEKLIVTTLLVLHRQISIYFNQELRQKLENFAVLL